MDSYKLLKRYIHFEKPAFYVRENGTYLSKVVFRTTDKETKDLLILYARDRNFKYMVNWKRYRTLEGNRVIKHFISIHIDKEYDSVEETKEAITEFGDDLLNYIINYKGKLNRERMDKETEIEDFLEDGKAIDVYFE